MKRLSLAMLTFIIAAPAFAQNRYACTPLDGNSYFVDDVSLIQINDSQIELNNVKLERDATYKPRANLKDYDRYNGDTEEATGWADSGVVEVLVSKEPQATKTLKIRVRGEMFISEDFVCKKAD
jgi:hypothetical protein